MFTDTQSSAKATVADTPTRKFMFERSFDGAPGRVPERKPVTLKPEQYDALKQESYDAGFAAGSKTGLDEKTGQLNALISIVGDKIGEMIGNMEALQKESQDGMRLMALTMAKKFVPELLARQGVQEIEGVIAEVMSEMVHEPRLVVRIHESQFDVLNEKIKELAEQKAYAGKVIVLADGEIAVGDCHVEWADGGMERKAEDTWEKIEQVVKP